MYVHSLDYGDSVMGVYKCHNIKLYMLNMHSLLYVNYTSTKLFRELNK